MHQTEHTEASQAGMVSWDMLWRAALKRVLCVYMCDGTEVSRIYSLLRKMKKFMAT